MLRVIGSLYMYREMYHYKGLLPLVRMGMGITLEGRPDAAGDQPGESHSH